MFITKQACYIFAFQVVAIQLLMAGPTASQGLKSYIVRLEAKEQTLHQVFAQIEAQTDLTFAYTQKVLRDPVRISIRTQTDLHTALREISRTSRYTFRRVDRNIYVIPTAEKHAVVVTEQVPNREISGQVVIDETGEPLPGANVWVKQKSNLGTTTDAEGRFHISVPDDTETLVISFIGYQSKEVSILRVTDLVIRLLAESHALNEIVVVGYGTQKKVNLTGAVDQVTSEALESRPVATVGQSLQGMVPNLNITFGDGTPGEGANFNIRGTTSINGGEPLILIDGIPGDPTLINPRDIESVSILKDAASAAVYGARGAYGVILINTKIPKRQAPVLAYNGNYSFNTPTILPRAVTDPYLGMTQMNDARMAWDGAAQFTAEDMAYAQERSQDPSLPPSRIIPTSSGERYQHAASTDWINEMYKKGQPMQQHNLSISGGSENVRYYISGGLFNQQGVLNYDADKFKRYNFRGKVDIKILDWLSVDNNLMFNRGIKDFPAFWGTSTDIWRYVAVSGNPNIPVTNPDGTWSSAGRYVGFLKDGGRSMRNENLLQNTLGVNLSFLNDKLRIVGKYTMQNDGYRQNDRVKPLSNISTTPGTVFSWGANRVVESNTDNYYNVVNAFTEYEDQLGDHYFKGTMGYNQEMRQYNYAFMQREDVVSDELSSISLGVGDIQVGGNAYEWAIRGAFYRFNYIFRDKYLVEVNGRYDGSSRFPSSERFGFFPSASAGWRISKENFFGSLAGLVSDLKLRASYGSLGNQNLISNYYPYVATMGTFKSPVIINSLQPIAIGSPGSVSNSLTWETATTYDVGLDAGLLDNRLGINFDYYIRDTKNMLTKSKTLPAVLGTSEPIENAADLRTRGWELSAAWNDDLSLGGSPLTYNVRVVLSDYTAMITRFDNPNKYLGDYYEGQRFGEIWGFRTLGFFQNQEEIDSHADQSQLMRQPDKIQPGDLKFADLNGDNVVDFGENTADKPGDRFVIGNREPRYSYGTTASLGWKGFSLSIFFQGIGKKDYYPGSEASYFWSVYNRPYNTPLEHIVGNYWTPENPNAYFPRLKGYIALNADKELEAEQTRYLQDASYLRLKNLTVGYTFNNTLVERLGLRSLRVYFSGENMWETSGLVMPVDPESLNFSHSQGDGATYPFSRSYSFGLDISL